MSLLHTPVIMFTEFVCQYKLSGVIIIESLQMLFGMWTMNHELLIISYITDFFLHQYFKLITATINP